MNVKNRSSLAELRPAGTMQELTVAHSPVSFAALPETSRYVWITVATQSVSVSVDGVTAPDTAVGIGLAVNYEGLWSKETAAAASFHQRGGAAVVYGQPMA